MTGPEVRLRPVEDDDLPIFLAHYNAANAAQAGNSAAYTGTNWTNTTFLGYLAANNPVPYNFASTNATNGLLGNATFRNNAVAAGLPANFFVVNPNALGGANHPSIAVSPLDSPAGAACRAERSRCRASGSPWSSSRPARSAAPGTAPVRP